MIKLKIQKNKSYIKLFIRSKIKKKSNLPIKVGINKKDKFLNLNYTLIMILQKYGFTLSEGMRRFCLTNLIK